MNLPYVDAGTEDVETSTVLGVFRPPREERMAEEILQHPGITYVVFGHTHTYMDGNALGTSSLHGCWFNTGTWQPHLDLNRSDVKMKLETEGITYEILEDKRLYDISLHAVRIHPNAPNRATVELIPIC